MTSIQNPTDLSDYDWLEFVSFAWKTDREGYSYAVENYSPDFEAPDMQALAADMGKLRAYYRANVNKVEQWAETVGWGTAVNLHNAHVDESRQRERDACLWGVRCTDGHVIHLPSEAARGISVSELLANSRYRQPAALLHRDVPGGEWTDSPLFATT